MEGVLCSFYKVKWRAASATTILWLTYCIFISPPPAKSQVSSTEYQVKAAFLYNFAKFVDWPPQSFPRTDSPFTICLAGDPFEGELNRIVQGEALAGRPIVVRRLARGDGERGCEIIYVALSEAQRSDEIIRAAGGMPILTVGETPDFINKGGMIRFIKTGGRIHFQINPSAAERASLKVSSRLLRVAEVVERGEDK